MTKVTIVLRKDKINKSCQAPIHLRIIKNRKIRYIATGLFIPIHQWDKENKQLKKAAVNSSRINAFLSRRLADLQDLSLKQEIENPKNLSAQSLKLLAIDNKENNFLKFAYDFIKGYAAAGQIGTYDRFRTTLNKLKFYVKNKQLNFSDINVTFLVQYERYLKETLKNKTNTVHSNMKVLRRIFNAAYDQDIIELGANPFFKFKSKTEKTTRTYLSEEEIKLLEDMELPENSKMDSARNIFVWAMCAGGRISDIMLLKWQNYDGNRISWTIKKTKQQHSIKLPAKAIRIIENLKDNRVKDNPYIFNLLDSSLKENDPRMLDKAISRATAIYNKQLKQLAIKAGITKPLSSHVSRHSFATRALRRGISLDKVQYILQHHSPAVTQIYAKLANEEVDKAMNLMN